MLRNQPPAIKQRYHLPSDS